MTTSNTRRLNCKAAATEGWGSVPL
jgi:hypothetical protein